MLGHRRTRWASITPALCQSLSLADVWTGVVSSGLVYTQAFSLNHLSLSTQSPSSWNKPSLRSQL